MTIAPAPRRGLFLCVLLRTLRPFFRFMQPFLGVLWGRTGCIFFCAHFSALLQSFFARIFSKFRVFFVRLFPPFRPFSGGILRQFRRLFCAVFCFVCRPPGKITTGSQSRKQGGTEQRSFLRPFLSRFGYQSTPAKPHKQRPERHQTRAHVRVRISSFFLCLYCAISVPPWLPIATHSNTPEAMKNPGIKPFSAKYRGFHFGGR